MAADWYTTCIHTVRYEWDETKNRRNQRIHEGVSFEATLVFEDEHCLVFPDWWFTHIGKAMAKKSSASSHPVKLKSMTSEDIKNRKWTEKERQALRRIAERQAVGDDSGINFTDIPRLTPEQLAQMVRLRDVRRKVAVSVRLDPPVLEWLKLKSKGEGHLTLINDILVNLMEAERKAS